MIKGTPQFGPWLEDPDPPDHWTDEDYAAMRRRLRAHWRGEDVSDASWNEADHPRGQPDNPGKFGPGGGGSSKSKGGKGVPKRSATSPPGATAAEALAAAAARKAGKGPDLVKAAKIKAETEKAEADKLASERKAKEGIAGVSSAVKLYKPPARTAEDIVASVPGAKEAIAAANDKLSKVVQTHLPVEQGGFKQPDGNYTPERAAIHDKIIAEYINAETIKQYSPKPGEAPLLTILGGRGGSGKSWLSSKDGPINSSTSMVIDNDEVKSKLPEYEGWNAAQLHEEASDIVAQIDATAAKLGLNVVLDGTLKSKNILQRIAVYQSPQEHEYELEGYYMYASPETAATRALGRFSKGGGFKGRYVPPEVILGNTKNEENFDTLSSGFRKWAVYDNEGERGSPRLVEQSQASGERSSAAKPAQERKR